MVPVLLLAALAGAAASESQPNEPEVQVRRDTIVVTGTYEPLPLEESDRSLRVFPVRRLSLVANTFADLLKLDPSLDLRQRAPNTVQSDLSIRGAGFGQTLVLLNGLRLNDVQSGHHNLDLPVPLESIDRIEVLKGTGSTLYGSDAIGGVVNFLTNRPRATELRLRTAVGNFGVNQQRAAVAWAGTAMSEELAVSRDFSTGFIPNRDYRNLSLASTTHLSSRLGASEIALAHNDRPFGAEQFYGNFNSWERTRGWFASLRQGLGRRTEASLGYRRHTDLFVLYRDRPQVFTNRHAVESYQVALRRFEQPGTNWKWHYGVEGYRDSIVSNNLGRHERARGAVYTALDARALKRFSFNAGVRDEIHGSFEHEWSPALSAGAWLSPALKLRGGVSRAFRLPTYTDLYYHDPANLGSPDLRPERAWNYEAGADWNWRGRVRGDVAVFQRRERDGIDYVRRSLNEIWRATNFQRLRFTGVEVSTSVAVARNQAIELHYTHLSGAQEALSGLLSKYAFNYPVHAGVASWQGLLPGGILARARAGALQRLAREPYAVVDLYAAWSRGRFHPFVQVTNVTDTFYQEVLGVDMPGRAAMVGIEVTAFQRRK
ncbi:MAG: TonB-dependent receptor [Acidobacteria bacterium]|nr:TonB-dependent receptor [Acidobacteriota bacterium]